MTDGKPEFGTPGEEKEEQSRLFADFAEGYARRWSVTPDNFAYDPDAHLFAVLYPLSDGNEAERTYYGYEGEEGNPPQLQLLVRLKQGSAGGEYSFRQYSFVPEDAEQGLQKIEYDPKKYFGVHIGVPVGADKNLRRTNVLAALGIKIQRPGIETDSSKAFRQALRKTTESSEPVL